MRYFLSSIASLLTRVSVLFISVLLHRMHSMKSWSPLHSPTDGDSEMLCHVYYGVPGIAAYN